jgi:hypothetical protein
MAQTSTDSFVSNLQHRQKEENGTALKTFTYFEYHFGGAVNLREG